MSDHRPSDPEKLKRQKRLEESLKENLRRRKAQARARIEKTAGEEEQAPADEPARDPSPEA